MLSSICRIVTSEFVGIYFWHPSRCVPKPDNFYVIALQAIKDAIALADDFTIGQARFRHNSTAFGKAAERQSSFD